MNARSGWFRIPVSGFPLTHSKTYGPSRFIGCGASYTPPGCMGPGRPAGARPADAARLQGTAAAGAMADERRAAGHTLQATALVNEAYLRLVDINRIQWQNRAHFFAMAARQMRRILIDAARKHGNQKRGGDVQKVSLAEGLVVPDRPEDLVALDEALVALTQIDERRGRVVEMKFFGGLSVEEIAAVLNVSPDTVKRDWKLAKAWLGRELENSRTRRVGE